MIIYHQTNVAAFKGAHVVYFLPSQLIVTRIAAEVAAPAGGRVMSSLAAGGGLAGKGGIAGDSGGLAG